MLKHVLWDRTGRKTADELCAIASRLGYPFFSHGAEGRIYLVCGIAHYMDTHVTCEEVG